MSDSLQLPVLQGNIALSFLLLKDEALLAPLPFVISFASLFFHM